MKMKLFSIFDSVAGVFMSPFVARSDVDAKRQVIASRDDPNIKATPVGSKPFDFALFELGQFDDEDGVISPNPRPTRVASIGELWAEPTASTVSP